jgi:hypothetical protein
MSGVVDAMKAIFSELSSADTINDFVETIFILMEKLGRDFNNYSEYLVNVSEFLPLYLDSSDSVRPLGPRRLVWIDKGKGLIATDGAEFYTVSSLAFLLFVESSKTLIGGVELVTSVNGACKGGCIDPNLSTGKILTLLILMDGHDDGSSLSEETPTRNLHNSLNNRDSSRPSGVMNYSTFNGNSNVKLKTILIVYNGKVLPLVIPRYKRFDLNTLRSLDYSALDSV